MHFISHASEDREFVEEEIISFLKAMNVEYKYSPEHIRAGDFWHNELIELLESCDVFILVMSNFSSKSSYVKAELNWAIEKRKKIFPIMIENCRPLDFDIRLSSIQFFDYQISNGRSRMSLSSWVKNTNLELRLNGNWRGTVTQKRGPENEPIYYTVDLTLDTQGIEGISGSMFIQTEVTELEQKFEVKGGFFHSRFFQFSYKSTDPKMIQFGTAIFEMDSTGREMTGQFIGYGAFSNRIVEGGTSLKKVYT